MILALDGRLTLSFTTGLLAAVNPCGFVLLPTYLLYFLGMENMRPGAEKASVGRALAVSLSVSAGFLSVFVVIGVITKWSTRWFIDKAPYVSLVIGALLIVLGVAMLFGYRLPFTTPKLDVGQRDRSVVSMFVFGIAYAVASLGCTLGPFIGTVLGAISTKGIVTGIAAIGMYGLGMALLVTGLTVTLALANTALLKALRKGMVWFEYVAGVFVLLTGLYLTYYWYQDIRDQYDSSLVTGAVGWQENLSRFIQRNQTGIVVLASLVVVAAVGVSLWRHQHPAAEGAASE
ncbi:MAG: cytochrome c biogenesis protein CcdA [Ilumatobacter sp.]|nr:cytochrome c biogenesis protein CcdA [Ilumatobacter sp.]MCB0985490.1 cytochrome c biogenesis protein CcdA [Ilumatobacter sp.]MCB0985494.1 cytochrome c biogenesis protein CcdA [Ilumatobacter sp.]